MANEFVKWMERNMTWMLIALVLIYFIRPLVEESRTIMYVIFFESLAIGLSNLAVYLTSKIPFVAAIIYGTDGKLNSTEQHSFIKTIGLIFLGVHILVGFIVMGMYLAQFNL